MSASSVATLPPTQDPMVSHGHSYGGLSCSNCGVNLLQTHQDIAQDAQRRITELEDQVKVLTSKATAAGELTFQHSRRRLHRELPPFLGVYGNA
jgi:hypothetical protein